MFFNRLPNRMAAVLSLILIGSAALANYPTKPIKLIIPLGAGGSHDQNAQVFTSILPLYLGQEFEIEFLPGEDGRIGTSAVANADPDGYTLLFSQNYYDVLQQYVAPTDYDPMNDLIPVARINYAPTTFVVRADSPFTSYREVIEAAKSQPNGLKISHSGDWGATYVPALQIMNAAKAEFELIEYQGAKNAMAALLSGDVNVTLAFPSAVAPYLESGDLKVLATAGDERIFPNVPSFEDVGLSGDIGFMHRVVFAPAGTSPEVIASFSAAFEHLLSDNAYLHMMGELGENVDFLNAERYQNLRKNQNETYRDLVNAMAN